jgi:uncharacterized membrane protein
MTAIDRPEPGRPPTSPDGLPGNLYPKDRIAALTDGIFAVAMTLLVLDLKVPDGIAGGPSTLWAHLVALSGRIDDYVISFLVLCAFWLSHHRLMAQVRGVDPKFLWINFAFVLFTTFVPATTALVGNYPREHLSALIYGANVLLVLVSEILLWRHGTARVHADAPDVAHVAWREARRRFLFALGVTLAAIGVAMIEIWLGIGVVYSSYLYLVVLGAVVSRAHVPT